MEINQKLVKILKRKKIKISLAESCTGGLVSSNITSVSGASKVFTMGLITYSNHAKIKILKVPAKLIKKYGAVSKECCLVMVNNLSKISKSQVSVSITGIAGPKGGSKIKPVGMVFIGLKFGKKVLINKYFIQNKGRNFIQKQTNKITLRLIIKTISKK